MNAFDIPAQQVCVCACITRTVSQLAAQDPTHLAGSRRAMDRVFNGLRRGGAGLGGFRGDPFDEITAVPATGPWGLLLGSALESGAMDRAKLEARAHALNL